MLALLVQLSVVLAQEELIPSAQLVLRETIFSLLLMILLAQRHVLVDTTQTLERMYVTLARLSARHVQDRTIINVKAVLLGIMRVQQKLALLVQLSVLLAQEVVMISVQAVLRAFIFSLLLMILLAQRHVPVDIIQTL